MTEVTSHNNDEVLAMTTEIVSAYASRNQMPSGELPDLIRTIHAKLNGLAVGALEKPSVEVTPEPLTPAVPIDASVGKDAVTCLECGKSFKTLKRHLSSEHDLTAVDYRARWQLSKDYPLVAPTYSKQRAATAKKIGLGRKPKAK